ncbi:hypothetical protein [Acidipropionibacterium jensenii]|uniref:hypothetical protein n=1 Tax=Acidipropionibacterium jensenii TaxID=1749 RepID=UPI001F437385|nr:hypothetical protein [Acidipropionibacterium jensenii]
MAQELTPKMRTEMPMIHRNAGGLSTVMKFAASEDPKNSAFHDWEAACAAAE